MRYLIALLIFSIQAYGQILKPQERVERHITYSTQQLQKDLFKGPSFQQPIVYIDYSPLYPNILGLTRKIGNGFYIIDLNPGASEDQLEWVLMHELVHVWQLHNKFLSKDEKNFYWKNRAYPFNHPYKTRPWEAEAEALTSKYCHPINRTP